MCKRYTCYQRTKSDRPFLTIVLITYTLTGPVNNPNTLQYWQTILSTLWIDSSSTDNQKYFTSSFSYLIFGYDIAQTCAHVCKTSHYINNKKVCCKAKWETIYKNSVLFKLPTKSLVIGPVSHILHHNVNSSWHALIKCHAIMFTEVGIHSTHTFPQFLDTSWIHQSAIWEVPRSVQWNSNLGIVQAIEGVEMVVMPTIPAQSCWCIWDH